MCLSNIWSNIMLIRPLLMEFHYNNVLINTVLIFTKFDLPNFKIFTKVFCFFCYFKLNFFITLCLVSCFNAHNFKIHLQKMFFVLFWIDFVLLAWVWFSILIPLITIVHWNSNDHLGVYNYVSDAFLLSYKILIKNYNF